MNTALRSLNRQTILAVAVFFAVLTATCVWGVSFVIANHQLQGEFETKSRVLDELKKRALAAGVVDGGAADTRGAVISAPPRHWPRANCIGVFWRRSKVAAGRCIRSKRRRRPIRSVKGCGA